KEEPAPPFKPVAIKSELTEDDPKDEKTNYPAKKYDFRFQKDRTYLIELETKDFDGYLRILDKKGKKLVEDELGAEDLNSRLIFTAQETAEHQIVATSNDDQVGKFTLKVRELDIKGEAKPRALDKDGLKINADLAEKDATDLGPMSKVFSVQLKPGKA